MEMYGYAFACESDLAHHGIKGMHWGIRRYQNADGSLTAAGRERYFGKDSGANHAGDVEGAKKRLAATKLQEKAAQGEYNRQTAGGMIYNEEATKKLINAQNETIFAEEDVRNEKVKDKLSKEGKVSARREKLIDEYKKKGMTDEEAEVAAYKRERTERMLKVAGAVAVTAAVAYGAAKYKEYNFDSVIKMDTSLTRIATSDTKSVQDAFYAVFSKNKTDITKYAGLYADQIQKGVYGHKIGTDVFQKTLHVTGDLNVASPKSAMKALSDLVQKDPQYREDLKKILNTSGNFGWEEFQSVKDDLDNGKVSRKVYETLNVALGGSAKKTDVAKKFYDEMTNRGYNAIKDINDSKYSGFMTKTPMLVFNAQSKVSVDQVDKLSKSAISANNAKALADIGRKTFAKQLAPTLAAYTVTGVGTVATTKAVVNKQRDKIVADYRKEHPNTNLSYNDIVRNYYQNQSKLSPRI